MDNNDVELNCRFDKHLYPLRSSEGDNILDDYEYYFNLLREPDRVVPDVTPHQVRLAMRSMQWFFENIPQSAFSDFLKKKAEEDPLFYECIAAELRKDPERWKIVKEAYDRGSFDDVDS